MNTTLTNDQITAGAAVLCDHGQPIGRNAAIEVADAMDGVKPTIPAADVLTIPTAIMNLPPVYQAEPGDDYATGYATGHRDARHAAADLVLARADELKALAAPSPQIAEKVKDAELIELAKLAGYTFARTTTPGVELLAGNVEAHERLMRFGALAIAASRRATVGEDNSLNRRMAEYIVAGAVESHYDPNGPDYRACACCDNEIQIDAFQKPKNGAELTHKDDCLFVAAQRILATPAPASAGQAAPAELYECIGKGGQYELIGTAKGAGPMRKFDDLRIYRAGNNGQLYFRTCDDFDARMRRLAAQPAEVSAGQAGQVAKYKRLSESTVRQLALPHAGAVSVGDYWEFSQQGLDAFAIDLMDAVAERAAAEASGAISQSTPVVHSVQSDKAAAANAGELAASPTGEQLYTMVTSRFKGGSLPWAMASESGKAAWGAAAAELAFAPDTIMARHGGRTPAADAGSLDAAEAARWRALLASARIRIIGSAGINQDTSPTGEPYNNYAHFGMEIWTKYGTSLTDEQKAQMEEGNVHGRAVLTKYADIAMAAQGGRAAATSAGKQ